MLANLHEIALNTRQRYRDEFSANEVVLSQSFKDAYGASLRRDGQNIDFTPHTAIVTTSGNLKMYIPNQWFCAAAYTVEYIRVLMEYKELTEAIIGEVCPNATRKKEYIKNLKESSEPDIISNYKARVSAYMRDRVPGEELEITVEYLTHFATDYQWWFGNKTIDRGDFYVSPVLSLLGVVNASQSYIAEISYRFANDPELTLEAGEMLDRNFANTADEMPVNPAAGIEHGRVTGGINEIVYGAPGTGKSRYLEDEYGRTTQCSRVVFHPEYTFYDFVGSDKPVTLYKQVDTTLKTISGQDFTFGEPVVDYRFVPGPFIKTLVNAWMDPANMYTLIIEEINRANTAAVFGEVFQLLDRDVNGTSEYGIDPSEDLMQYLLSVPGMETHLGTGLRIPSNMNLVATMNSADQGVMPMDAAFKRRWSFNYQRIAIDGAVHANAAMRYAGREVRWGCLVKAINAKLMELGLEEDRMIGPYFIKPDEIGSQRARDKLLLYLWDDVLRYNRDGFFSDQIHTFADLSDKFEMEDTFELLNGNHAHFLLNQMNVINEQNETAGDADEMVEAE